MTCNRLAQAKKALLLSNGELQPHVENPPKIGDRERKKKKLCVIANFCVVENFIDVNERSDLQGLEGHRRPSPTLCECGGANVLIHSGHYRLRALMWDQLCECSRPGLRGEGERLCACCPSCSMQKKKKKKKKCINTHIRESSSTTTTTAQYLLMHMQPYLIKQLPNLLTSFLSPYMEAISPLCCWLLRIGAILFSLY